MPFFTGSPNHVFAKDRKAIESTSHTCIYNNFDPDAAIHTLTISSSHKRDSPQNQYYCNLKLDGVYTQLCLVSDLLNKFLQAESQNMMDIEFQSLTHFKLCLPFYSQVKFDFHSIAAFEKCVSHLPDINYELGYPIFSIAIINELKQIAAFLKNEEDHSACKDLNFISEILALPTHVRRSEIEKSSASSRLVDFMDQNEREDILNEAEFNKAVKLLLVKGEHPDQVHKKGFTTPIRYAVRGLLYYKKHIKLKSKPSLANISHEQLFKHRLRLLELLLAYGADPLRRDAFQTFRLSALDEVLIIKKWKIAEIIRSYLDKPRKSISRSISIDIAAHYRGAENKIITQLSLYNGKELHATLTATLCIDSKKELEKDILRLCCDYFSAIHDDKQKNILIKMILEDLHEPNRLVEVIRNDKNEMIGFNLFHILIDSENIIYWYCSLTVLDNAWRNYGLTPLFAFQLAYSLQMLYQKYEINIFLLAIHPNSYRLLEGILHWPKHQPQHLAQRVQWLLKELAVVPSASYHNVALDSYVDKQLAVSQPESSCNKLIQNFFYHDLLKQKDWTSGFKAATILYPVADQSFQLFDQHCQRFGINTSQHISMMTELLSHFLDACKLNLPRRENNYPDNCLKDCYRLFWFSEKKPSQRAVLPAHFGYKSKL